MKNPLYFVAYSAGFYKTGIMAVMKLIMVLIFILMLIFTAMKVFDLTIELKRSGDILWLLK